MALSAITVARRHGSRTFETIIDASVHPGEHKAAFREIAANREHPEFAEVQIWESNVGVTKSKKFREVTPAEDEKPQDEKPEAENSEGDTSAKTSSEPSAAKKKAGSSK